MAGLNIAIGGMEKASAIAFDSLHSNFVTSEPPTLLGLLLGLLPLFADDEDIIFMLLARANSHLLTPKFFHNSGSSMLLCHLVHTVAARHKSGAVKYANMCSRLLEVTL